MSDGTKITHGPLNVTIKIAHSADGTVFSGSLSKLTSDYVSNKLNTRNSTFICGIGDEVAKRIYSVSINSNSLLFKKLQESKRDLMWVDIEHLFYQELKSILYNNNANHQAKIKMLKELNSELEDIKNLLREYLEEETKTAQVNSKYIRLAENSIDATAILERHHVDKLSKDEFTTDNQIIVDKIMFLDFNYTQIIKTAPFPQRLNIQYNHIHGTLEDKDNPMIFGYGDEIDDSYLEMEKTNINEYLKHIKSFGYFKSMNYSNLVSFINSEPFVVYIWGHSCGLSDRTLLNMIFENDYCAGIKVFYRIKSDMSDNFDEITQNISRHFKNKVKMRNRVFNKTMCSKIPKSE